MSKDATIRLEKAWSQSFPSTRVHGLGSQMDTTHAIIALHLLKVSTSKSAFFDDDSYGLVIISSQSGKSHG